MKFYIPKYTDTKYPLLTPANAETSDANTTIEYIDPDFVAQYELLTKRPRKIIMGDYHYASRPIVSNRLKEILELFNLTDVQYIRATIDTGKSCLENYWMLHVTRFIQCLDREKSEFAGIDDEIIFDFDKLVLDTDILKSLPEKDRLLFRLEEDTSVYVWSDTLLNAIEKLFSPAGIDFVPSEEWSTL